MLIATCHSQGFFLNTRFSNSSWCWQWCTICSMNYQMTWVFTKDWKYVLVYVIHGWSGARSFFHIVTFPWNYYWLFLRYSIYYCVTNFYYGSFRRFFIISDFIFIIAVVYNIANEYIAPLFHFCFDWLLIVERIVITFPTSSLLSLAFFRVVLFCCIVTLLYCDPV